MQQVNSCKAVLVGCVNNERCMLGYRLAR
jgi:hypothetical protein